MPALSTTEAAERLAKEVELARPSDLSEIYAELHPQEPTAKLPSAAELARQVRNGLEAEELVDLWNVIFPASRNVWYDEEQEKIHYSEEALGYAEAD